MLAYFFFPAGTYPDQYGNRMIVLGMLQSIFSYGCDSHTFGKNSIWKPLDRLHSRCFILYFLYWQWHLYDTSTRLEIQIFGFCLVTGVYSFVRSLKTLLKPEADQTNFNQHVYWHILWHLILPAGYLAMGFVRTLAQNS